MNPDPLIDFYMVNGNAVDPRIWQHCESQPDDKQCRLGGRDGMAPTAEPNRNRRSSGYLLVNIVNSDAPAADDPFR